jgi:hypothetical protein
MCEYQPPLTAESRAIAAVHKWLESPTPAEASRFSVSKLVGLVEYQIAEAKVHAVERKEIRILGLVAQWHRAFLRRDRKGQLNALRGIARECGGEIPDFREIPAH